MKLGPYWHSSRTRKIAPRAVFDSLSRPARAHPALRLGLIPTADTANYSRCRCPLETNSLKKENSAAPRLFLASTI